MLISLGGYLERRFDCCILSIRCNYAICSPMNAACVMNINELHRFLPMAESWLMNINKQALAAVGFVNSRFTGGWVLRARETQCGRVKKLREGGEITPSFFLTASTENGGIGFFVSNLQIPVWLLSAVRVISGATAGPSVAFGVSAGFRLSSVWVCDGCLEETERGTISHLTVTYIWYQDNIYNSIIARDTGVISSKLLSALKYYMILRFLDRLNSFTGFKNRFVFVAYMCEMYEF